MKLTPEHKAILAYGEARGILKERKSLMRFTEGLGECSDYHGEPRMMYGVEEAIRDAWKKRAACRRTCAECETYHNELKDSYGTIWCDYINNYTRGKNKCVGCPFFESRKEGE